jgi:hypothetical protein
MSGDNRVTEKAVLQIRIHDPVPFCPWSRDPVSGIGFSRIPDPTIISESLKPIFSWVKK